VGGKKACELVVKAMIFDETEGNTASEGTEATEGGEEASTSTEGGEAATTTE